MTEKQTSSLVQPSQSRKHQLRQSPSWDKCLCHVQDESGTLTNFSDKSWLRFQACANRRNDAIWAKMKGYWEEGRRANTTDDVTKYTLIRLKSQGPLRNDIILSSKTLWKIITVTILLPSLPQQNEFQGPRLMHLT